MGFAETLAKGGAQTVAAFCPGTDDPLSSGKQRVI